jgi:hypothetical protein
MSKYELIPFDQTSLHDARSKWEAIAGEDAFDLEFSGFFEWAEKHLAQVEGDSIALNLHNNDALRTDAIVEVVSSRKGQMSKLLKVIPSPMFWDVNNSRADIVTLYTEVFFNVLTRQGFGSSRTVKLYGRDDEMMSILRSIHSLWSIPNTKAEFEGRFLTFTLN